MRLVARLLQGLVTKCTKSVRSGRSSARLLIAPPIADALNRRRTGAHSRLRSSLLQRDAYKRRLTALRTGELNFDPDGDSDGNADGSPWDAFSEVRSVKAAGKS